MKKNFLRVFLSFVLIASFVTLASAAVQGKDGKPYHLKLGYSPSICGVPLNIAVEKGFFAAEGIEAENIQVAAAHIQEAVAAGQVEAGQGLIGKFLQPLENGLEIKFTAGTHTGCNSLLVPADSDIKQITDLRGKRIGVSGLASADIIVVKRALAAEGISVDMRDGEVEFAVFPINDLPMALKNGAVDAIALNDPFAAQAIKELGLRTLIDTAVTEPFGSEYCCAAFVSSKLAKERPDVAAAFTRAVLKASVWVQEHPDEAAKIQLDKKYVAGEQEFNASIIKHYNYKPSVQGGYDAIKLSVQQLSEIGVIKRGTDAKKFADNCYAFFDDVPDTYTVEESKAPID